MWLGLQEDVDLWDAMKENRKAYEKSNPQNVTFPDNVGINVDRRTGPVEIVVLQ